MTEGIVYFCERCGDQLGPEDEVIQTVRMAAVDAQDEAATQERRGGWFHVDCELQSGHREVTRGRLAEVVARIS